MDIAEAFLDELAERVAAKVLARLQGAGATTHYGTGRAATLPPGKSRAWALRNLRHVPEARKIGRDWIVPVEAFDAWASERDAARFRRVPKAPAANDVESTDLEAMIAADVRAAGFRRTR